MLLTVWLEIHLKLASPNKLFCRCANIQDFENIMPNTNICPVCTAQPGALPVLSQEPLDLAVRLGRCLGCKIHTDSSFDRKSYFYPDLPTGYQITQFYHPTCTDGQIEFFVDDDFTKSAKIRIRDAHIENDTAKTIHLNGQAMIDFNRAGTPLVEIVTQPDFNDIDTVIGFLKELQRIARYNGISDADMDRGQMRVDVNISIRKNLSDDFGQRVEMKNVSSFGAIRNAITNEYTRQVQAIANGQRIEQETRMRDDMAHKSTVMRTKETALDYRYFPEPDLGIIRIIDDENVGHPENFGIAENKKKGSRPLVPNNIAPQDENIDRDAINRISTKKISEICEKKTHNIDLFDFTITNKDLWLEEKKIDNFEKVRYCSRAIVRNIENKIIVLNFENDGWLEFPGWWLENSENHEQWLIREIKEETWCDVRKYFLIGQTTEIMPNINQKVISKWYIADTIWNIKNLKLDEEEKVRWLKRIFCDIGELKGLFENTKLPSDYRYSFATFRDKKVFEWYLQNQNLFIPHNDKTPKILLATANPSKVARYKKFRKSEKYELINCDEMNIQVPNIKEDGKNEEEIVKQKAKWFREIAKIPCIADDIWLYLEWISESEQPGKFVKRIAWVTDEDDQKTVYGKMIKYYSDLANKNWWQIKWYFQDFHCLYDGVDFQIATAKRPIIITNQIVWQELDFPLCSLYKTALHDKFYHDLTEKEMEEYLADSNKEAINLMEKYVEKMENIYFSKAEMDFSNEKYIFHITNKQKSTNLEFFETESLYKEWYIHCSFANQILKIRENVFQKKSNLFILQIDISKLKSEIKYEDMWNWIFPHIYWKINKDAIISYQELDINVMQSFQNMDFSENWKTLWNSVSNSVKLCETNQDCLIPRNDEKTQNMDFSDKKDTINRVSTTTKKSPLIIPFQIIQNMKHNRWFHKEYINSIVNSKPTLDYFNELVKIWHDPKLIAKRISGPINSYLNKNLQEITWLPFDIQTLSDFLFACDKLPSNQQKILMDEMLSSWKNPQIIIKEKNLWQESGSDLNLDKIIDDVISANDSVVQQYKWGKISSIMFLVWQVMKSSQGKANPEEVKKLLWEKLW